MIAIRQECAQEAHIIFSFFVLLARTFSMLYVLLVELDSSNEVSDSLLAEVSSFDTQIKTFANLLDM